ncbi:MAG: hypothetical protein Q7R62_01580 [bacterium]|nr:hypothetical protein [bacterium]
MKRAPCFICWRDKSRAEAYKAKARSPRHQRRHVLALVASYPYLAPLPDEVREREEMESGVHLSLVKAGQQADAMPITPDAA